MDARPTLREMIYGYNGEASYPSNLKFMNRSYPRASTTIHPLFNWGISHFPIYYTPSIYHLRGARTGGVQLLNLPLSLADSGGGWDNGTHRTVPPFQLDLTSVRQKHCTALSYIGALTRELLPSVHDVVGGPGSLPKCTDFCAFATWVKRGCQLVVQATVSNPSPRDWSTAELPFPGPRQ